MSNVRHSVLYSSGRDGSVLSRLAEGCLMGLLQQSERAMPRLATRPLDYTEQ